MVETYNFTMLNVHQILVSAIGLAIVGVALTGCGQKGPLYLPTDPAAKNRATLPGLLIPESSRNEPANSPAQAPATTEGTK
ncbi:MULTISPECIES: LPS translocon maturation chaperone LptM [unclassified Variovorax]|nr:lipoprotein-attachment site-containing protein [Variovorax sp. CF079]